MDVTNLPGWLFGLLKFKSSLRIAEYSIEKNEITVQIINTHNFFKTSVEDLFNNGQFQLFKMMDIILLSYILGHNINYTNNFKLHGTNFNTDKHIVWDISNNIYIEETAINIFDNKDILFGLSKSDISEISFKAGVEYEYKNAVAKKILENDISLKIVKSTYYNGKMSFTVVQNKKETTLDIEEIIEIIDKLSSRDAFTLGEITNDLYKRVGSIN